MIKRVFILVVTIFSLSNLHSQNNNLDREKAAELLIDHFQYPNLEYIEIGTNFYCLKLSSTQQSFKDNNLIYEVKSYYDVNQSCWNYLYKHTDNNQKYHLITAEAPWKNTREFSRYIVARRNFKEVTGIRYNGDKTEATVEFSIVRDKITPFGIAIGKNNGVVNYKATLALYDDGWRIIDQTSYNYNYTLKKYPFL